LRVITPTFSSASYRTTESGMPVLLSAGLEKRAQQLAGALLPDTAVNFRPVMRRRLVEEARAVLDCAALWIVRPEIEPAQARQSDRRSAHRAGLEGNVEIALGKACRAQAGSARAQYQHLGMSGRVVADLDAIAGSGEDAAFVVDQHGADRYVAAGGRRLRFGKRQLHR